MPFLERIIKYIAPHLCIVCGFEGKIICDACRISCICAIPSSCFLCNKSTQDFSVCKACTKKTVLRHVWASSLYEGVVKNIIREYKFGHKRAASEVLCQIIIDTLPRVPFDVVAYVPTATSRVRQRGFDHAQLLAKNVAMSLDVPCVRALSRTTQTRQVGATRQHRINHMQQEFRLSVHPSSLSGMRVLIVDDVTSTGASIMAASRILKRCGARSVDAIVVARNTH